MPSTTKPLILFFFLSCATVFGHDHYASTHTTPIRGSSGKNEQQGVDLTKIPLQNTRKLRKLRKEGKGKGTKRTKSSSYGKGTGSKSSSGKGKGSIFFSSPTIMPSPSPTTGKPSQSQVPSMMPSSSPTTSEPSQSQVPSTMPSLSPSSQASDEPSQSPVPSMMPSSSPTTGEPSQSPVPSMMPSSSPTTGEPSQSQVPSMMPSSPSPSSQASDEPSQSPLPSMMPSSSPTTTIKPSQSPLPSMMPSSSPSSQASDEPSQSPVPTMEPSARPTTEIRGPPLIGVMVGSAIFLAIIAGVKLMISYSKVRNPGQDSSPDSDSDDDDWEPLTGSPTFPIGMPSSSEILMSCENGESQQGRSSNPHSSFESSPINTDHATFPIPSSLRNSNLLSSLIIPGANDEAC